MAALDQAPADEHVWARVRRIAERQQGYIARDHAAGFGVTRAIELKAVEAGAVELIESCVPEAVTEGPEGHEFGFLRFRDFEPHPYADLYERALKVGATRPHPAEIDQDTPFVIDESALRVHLGVDQFGQQYGTTGLYMFSVYKAEFEYMIIHGQDGIFISENQVPITDISISFGMVLTSPERTLRDLAERKPTISLPGAYPLGRAVLQLLATGKTTPERLVSGFVQDPRFGLGTHDRLARLSGVLNAGGDVRVNSALRTATSSVEEFCRALQRSVPRWPASPLQGSAGVELISRSDDAPGSDRAHAARSRSVTGSSRTADAPATDKSKAVPRRREQPPERNRNR